MTNKLNIKGLSLITISNKQDANEKYIFTSIIKAEKIP